MRRQITMWATVIAEVLLASTALCQTASLLPNGEQVFVDANGVPLAGGTACFYIPNTLNPKQTWQDTNETIPNTMPCVSLNSAGRAIIYGAGQYREIVKDLLGNTQWDQLTAGPVLVPSPTGQTGCLAVVGSAYGFVNCPVVETNVAALRANTVAYPTIHLQGYTGVADGGGGDVEYNASDVTTADNGCTVFVDAAGHRYDRPVGGSLPIEACGGGVAVSAGANTAALTAAATYGPYEIDMASAGTYQMTGIVMTGAKPHLLRGGGDGISTVSCSGISYANAGQLTGTLLASDPVCFQNGVESGSSQGKWIFEDIAVVGSGSTTIAVAVGDSTTANMAEGWTCRDSSITGFVGVYWGNSNANVMSNCSIFGTAASGSYAELYERPNVSNLVGGAVQNVIHIGGIVQMPTGATGTNIGMLDAGGSGAIGSNGYYDSRVEGESGITSCLTSVASSGGKGLNWFESVGFENCGTSGSPTIYAGTGTTFTNPGAEGQNTVLQLIDALAMADVLWESSFEYVGSAANVSTGGYGYVSGGATVRFFSGQGSPTGAVSALEKGDKYFRSGAGATTANSYCNATATGTGNWDSVSNTGTPC